MLEAPDAVRQWFVDAGWYPGRAVEVSASIPASHPAREVLAAFGGLAILERESEPDPDWPALDLVTFRELYPRPEITELWGQLLGTQLIGIASEQADHGEVYMAADGRYFGSSNVHPAFYYYGATLTEALECLLLDRRALPMLRPDQSSVTLYGEVFTTDGPELYRYR